MITQTHDGRPSGLPKRPIDSIVETVNGIPGMLPESSDKLTRKCNLFIHIPKTAGTTLGFLLDYATGRRIFWDYKEDYGAVVAPQYGEFLLENFHVIFGHFLPGKYSPILSRCNILTCVRDPVRRLLSNYAHDLNNYCRDLTRQSQGASSITNTGFALSQDNVGEFFMSIDEYLEKFPQQRHAQVSFLKGIDIDRLDFVFITEDLQRSYLMFRLLTGTAFERKDPVERLFPIVNEGQNRPWSYVANEAEYTRVKAILKEEYELYDHVCATHRALLDKYDHLIRPGMLPEVRIFGKK